MPEQQRRGQHSQGRGFPLAARASDCGAARERRAGCDDRATPSAQSAHRQEPPEVDLSQTQSPRPARALRLLARARFVACVLSLALTIAAEAYLETGSPERCSVSAARARASASVARRRRARVGRAFRLERLASVRYSATARSLDRPKASRKPHMLVGLRRASLVITVPLHVSGGCCT